MTPLRSLSSVLPVIALSLHFGVTASAANILWDGTGTSWNSATAWSLFSNATTPNPAAKPGASDKAIFNIETLFTAQTVNLNAPQAALGLVFNTTGGGSIVTGAGANTLTIGAGGISVSPGALPLSIQTAVNLSAPQTWNNDGGLVLNLNGAVNHNGNNLTIAGEGGSPLNGNTTINGALGAGSLTLTKNGGGTLRLHGANQFSGDLVVNAGSIVLGNVSGISTSPDVDVQFGPGSTGMLSLNGNSATVSSLTTDADVGTPVVQNGSNTAGATLTVENATDMTYGGVLQDGGSQPLGLTKRGAGTLTLTGTLPYTGETRVEAGAIKLEGPDDPLGAGVLTVNSSAGASFDLNGRNVTLNRVSFLGSASFPGLKQTAHGNSVVTLPFAIGQLDFSTFSVVGASEAAVEVTHSDGGLTLDGRLSGGSSSGAGTVYKLGAGTLILTRPAHESFNGRVVVEQGTLAIGHNLALGSGTLSLLGGAVRADSGARVVANRFSLNAPVGTFTGTDDLTLTGDIIGLGHLTKQGAGKLTLNNPKTYTGGTTVEEGVLAVNGSIPGDVLVSDTATLVVDGAIGGNVTVGSGGVLAPGDSLGEITLGSLTMQEGATLRLEIGGLLAGSQHDQVESAGAIALDGTLQVSLVEGFMPTVGQAFDLMNWATRTGAFDTLQLPALGGLFWNTSQLYTTGVLSVAVLTGDYNYDGLVDAADYTVWRDTLGSTTSLAADGSGNGIIDIPDFGIWRVNYGATAPANSAVVPEPAGLAAVVSALLMSAAKRRQAASGRQGDRLERRLMPRRWFDHRPAPRFSGPSCRRRCCR